VSREKVLFVAKCMRSEVLRFSVKLMSHDGDDLFDDAKDEEVRKPCFDGIDAMTASIACARYERWLCGTTRQV
jgi:hypothetical protein